MSKRNPTLLFRSFNPDKNAQDVVKGASMFCRYWKTHLLVILLAVGSYYNGSAVASETKAPEKWGIAMGLRVANIPFKAQKDTVYDIIPLIFYDNGRFFIEGLEMGYRIFKGDRWQLSPLGRYRFFDIPKEYQNAVREDGMDLGGQFTYQFTKQFHTDFEVLSDRNGFIHANLVPTFKFSLNRWDLSTYVRIRWKSSGFNKRYYGLDIENPGSAVDVMLAGDFVFYVYKNLYLIGQGTLTFLDQDTRDVAFIDRSNQASAFLGFGFSSDKKKTVEKLDSRPYVRLAHGWGTTSSLGDIISFKTERDPYRNQLSSLFVGVPLADELFTLPISTYLTPGIVLHHSSEVQDTFPEYVLAVKFYYTFKWPTFWRFGFAEGLSYVTEIPYLERKDMEEKGYRPSELLNFLDFSLDLNLGHLFRVDWMKSLWLGYGIHHRSGIFSTSSAFGRISGGSNYNTVYLQYHW